MPPSESELLTLAHAVADGAGVDWDRAEASAGSADERDAIAQLRRVASVAQAARAMASRWGPLEIRSEIGSGTFGTVYRAWDKRLEREVALKLLNGEHGEPQLASTVIKEGRLLAQIRHPNVVTVFGADAHDGRVGLWMEFVTGRTLKAILTAQGPYGAHEAAVIGRDLCRALAAVHRQGFLHRDVKAQNVMREAGGRTVLMDFGAGEVADAGPSADGALAGTPAYLAPEVLAGSPPSVRSDLYSLGVLLYYLVSGEFPVTGGSLAELRERHAQGRRTRLRDVRPDLPSAFVRVVDQATAADPAERPESAGAMEQLIESALGMRETDPASDAARESLEARPSKAERGRIRRWRAAAAALAVIAAAGATWSVWRRPAPAATAAVTRSSVAILPFRNLTSESGETDYLSDGMTDDLVAHLAMLRDLRVLSGASMRRYKDRTKTETEIGAELGVATVLDSSVRQSGGRVRIVSRLVDTRSGEQLWSESFERDLKDIFTMQAEVAQKIAVALKGELSSPDAARFSADPKRDFEAYSLYLKGRYYWGLRTEDGINRGIQYFTEAIARDPNYAAAYTGLADAYTSLGIYDIVPRADAYARAAAAAEKAIALDASLAEAHASLAYVQKNRFEWAAAEASFRRAIALKPSYAAAHHWYSIFLTQHGRFPEAIAEIKTAIALDPLSLSANTQLCSALLMARRYDSAIEQCQHALQIDPGSATAYRTLAAVYTHQGRYDQALAAFDQAATHTPVAAEDQELKADVSYVLALSGRRAEALATVRQLTDRYQRTGEDVAGSIAAIQTALGDRESAFEWLSRVRDARDTEAGYLKVHPRWDPLRRDPRFVALLTSLGFTP